MINFKTVIISACFLILVFAAPGHAVLGGGGDDEGGASSVSNKCSETRNQTEETMMDLSNNIYDTYVPSAEDYLEGGLKDCLSGISNASGGVSLGTPSLDGIISSACDIAVESINSYLDKVNDSKSIEVLDGAFSAKTKGGSSSGSGGVDVGFEDTTDGKDIADDLWGKINETN